EHFRERLPHRAVDRGSESDSTKPGTGRGRFSGGQRIPTKRSSKLGSTHRRTEGARGLGHSTGVAPWTAGCLLGLLTQGRKSFFGFSAGCARRRNEAPPS